MNDSKWSLIGEGRDFPLACSEQPQSRLEHLGPASLSDAELLALFLGGPTGSRKMDLAHQMIAEAGSLAGLSKLAPMDFRQLPGVGQVRSQLLVAVLEMSRRMTQATAETTVLNRPELIADYMQPTVRELEVEKFWVLCLNRKNRLKRRCEVTSGTATSSLAHPREVFRCAIRESATSIVCVHNHPSGVMPHPVLCRMYGAQSSVEGWLCAT